MTCTYSCMSSYPCKIQSKCTCTCTCNYFVGSCGPTHPSYPMTSSTTSASRYGPLKFRLLNNFQQKNIHVHCTCTSGNTCTCTCTCMWHACLTLDFSILATWCVVRTAQELLISRVSLIVGRLAGRLVIWGGRMVTGTTPAESC